ncbi:MAG: glycosyltransferase family 4 protein [bacterium]
MTLKKVLYIVTQSEWGGAQKYVYDLTDSFLKQGFEIGVVAGTEKNDLFNKLAVLESDKLTLFREKHLIRAINPFHEFIEFFCLVRIIYKFQPDAIHLNSSKAGILGTFAGWICRKKVVYTAHGFVFNENLSILIYLFYLWSEKICSFFRDKIITVSFYDFKSALEKKVAKAEKMVVIHNGIDMSLRDKILSKVEARGKLKEFVENSQEGATAPAEAWDNGATARNSENAVALESPETQVIGTVANLYENKGLKYLIEAAKIIINDMPNCLFILIGEGELKNKLRKLISDNKLQNNFFILGRVQDAYKYFRAFDAFCLPSIKEGLAYTLVEALMAGLPIVATNVGGNPEIVKNKVNGFLVNSRDKNALAEKIKILLKNKILSDKMGKESYEMADDFSLEKMVSETKAVYYRLN